MRHPFLGFTVKQRRWGFWFFLTMTLIVMVALNVIGVPLQTTAAAPQGIVSYELAGDVASTEAILASWDASARVHAGFSLGLDYLFMLLYAVTIALGCVWGYEVFGRNRPRWAGVGVILAWLMGAAALLDAVENAALWRMLAWGVTDPWPAVAAGCASVKFVLVGLGLLYVLTAAGGWLLHQRTAADK